VDAAVRECLCCGRLWEKRRELRDADAACPRCRYVGWAPAWTLTEAERRTLRERPLLRRRLRAVA
jgi:hypothetical protein